MRFIIFIVILFCPTIIMAQTVEDIRNKYRKELCIEYLKSVNSNDVIILAKNIYFEARGESLKGQLAVAFVTLNRVLSTKYPNTISEVVYQNKQFSWTKQKSKQIKDKYAWKKSLRIARLSIDLFIESLKENVPIMDDSCFYHHKNIKPSWSRKMKKLVVIDNHIFYKT